MTPEEIKKIIKDINVKVEEIKSLFNSLKDSTTIPLEIGVAMADRVAKNGVPNAKFANTTPVVHAVNESGSASYNVAASMTGFITFTVDGITYNIPYY